MFNKVMKWIKYFKLVNKEKSFFKKNESGNVDLIDPDISSLSQWYSNELSYASGQIELLEEENKIASTCAKGCFACCNQAIYINPVEFEILKDHLLKLASKDQKIIKKKAAYICHHINQTIIPAFFDDEIPNKKQKAIKEEYFEKKLSCPLLGGEGECLIYRIRPLVCLTYKSYGDKEECSFTYTPKYSHVFTYHGEKITEKMYDYYPVTSQSHKLLAFALKEIFQGGSNGL